ncbi:hypothetical protein GC207_11325 [bacterium]|nr:hypothetical protein [bacterium]
MAKRIITKTTPADLEQLPPWLEHLEPELRKLAVDWNAAKRRRMAAMFSRWSAQLIESADMIDAHEDEGAFDLEQRNVKAGNPAFN